MNKVLLKQAVPNIPVRCPELDGRVMPEKGILVVLTTFWRRRIQEGMVIVCDPETGDPVDAVAAAEAEAIKAANEAAEKEAADKEAAARAAAEAESGAKTVSPDDAIGVPDNAAEFISEPWPENKVLGHYKDDGGAVIGYLVVDEDGQRFVSNEDIDAHIAALQSAGSQDS